MSLKANLIYNMLLIQISLAILSIHRTQAQETVLKNFSSGWKAKNRLLEQQKELKGKEGFELYPRITDLGSILLQKTISEDFLLPLKRNEEQSNPYSINVEVLDGSGTLHYISEFGNGKGKISGTVGSKSHLGIHKFYDYTIRTGNNDNTLKHQPVLQQTYDHKNQTHTNMNLRDILTQFQNLQNNFETTDRIKEDSNNDVKKQGIALLPSSKWQFNPPKVKYQVVSEERTSDFTSKNTLKSNTNEESGDLQENSKYSSKKQLPILPIHSKTKLVFPKYLKEIATQLQQQKSGLGTIGKIKINPKDDYKKYEQFTQSESKGRLPSSKWQPNSSNEKYQAVSDEQASDFTPKSEFKNKLGGSGELLENYKYSPKNQLQPNNKTKLVLQKYFKKLSTQFQPPKNGLEPIEEIKINAKNDFKKLGELSPEKSNENIPSRKRLFDSFSKRLQKVSVEKTSDLISKNNLKSDKNEVSKEISKKSKYPSKIKLQLLPFNEWIKTLSPQEIQKKHLTISHLAKLGGMVWVNKKE